MHVAHYVHSNSYLKKGIQQRTTGSTEMNSSSSRSHAIFSIILKQQIDNNDEDPVQNDIPMLNLEDIPTSTRANSKLLVSKFHFVDLAGSERVRFVYKHTNIHTQFHLKCLYNSSKGLML